MEGKKKKVEETEDLGQISSYIDLTVATSTGGPPSIVLVISCTKDMGSPLYN